jgi:hypothetical protein
MRLIPYGELKLLHESGDIDVDDRPMLRSPSV